MGKASLTRAKASQSAAKAPARAGRLSLTWRLVIIALMSAVVPFAIAAAAVLAVPSSVVEVEIDSQLDQALQSGSTRLQARRLDLALALARTDSAKLTSAVQAQNAARVEQLVRAQLRSSADIEVFAGEQAHPDVAAVEELVSVKSGTQTQQVVVADMDAAKALADLEKELDVTYQLAAPQRTSLTSDRSAGSARIRGGAVDFASDGPSLWRSALLDERTRLQLVAAVDGSKLDLVMRGRGSDIEIALALLLVASLLTAAATAMFLDRVLGKVATAAESLSAGDYEQQLPVVGHDAGARVALSLNTLAGQLQERIGALETTVDRLDRTLAAIGDGVCTWSEDGKLETWNAGAESLAQVSEREARSGCPAADFLRTQLVEGERRVLLPVSHGQSHLVVDLAVKRMQNGGTLQVFRDATREMSIEQARANFLVTAAHQLRTPLTAILGFAATLADRQLQLTDDVRAISADQVLDQAKKLDEVVSSLVETSLIVQDRVEVNLERVDMRHLVRETVDASLVEGTRKKLGARTLYARADKDGLQRALVAVLDNAGKYGRAPIDVELSAADDAIEVVVRDHGEGIDAEHHEAVFEPFSRIDPEMRSNVGGTGMGLYRARRLIEAMGGTLTVSSPKGGGSQFTFKVPLWPQDQEA